MFDCRMSVATAPNVGRLAQYRPWERGGLDLRAVLRDLVIAAAAMDDGEGGTILECRRSFADLWGLEVEIDEIRPVIEELIQARKAEKTSTGFRLTAQVLDELRTKADESQEIEERAFREWELEVRPLAPGLTRDDLDLLCSDLRHWLHQIITRHGAEAALMLYPEDERARRFFDTVGAEGFDRLPDREGDLGRIRHEVLPLFIRSPTPDQRRFLASLLNTSFYMTVLTIDPEARQLVRAQLAGHRIYLDTNFLYAVLGAAPPDEVYSSRRLIQLSKDLGFKLAVTPWTMEELRTSIGKSRRDIERQRRFIRPELATTMLQAAGDKGFNRFFWQTYRDKRTQPKDVFDRLEHFGQDLASYGIEEETEGCAAVERQVERVGEYASLVGAERWPYQREPVVLEHDAKCRLLVERLRGDGNLSISNARFWFLTYDTKLPRFAERVPDNGDEAPDLPFCISPSAWVQIIRALTPRTEDFDRTIVDLLTSPFVGYRSGINSAVVQEVVGRMDHLEDASPEMALAVLTDTAKVSSIGKAIEGTDEDAVEDAVKIAYSTKAREMREAIAASHQRVSEIEDEIAAAENRVEEARLQHEEHAESASTDLRREREAWNAEKQRLDTRAAELEASRNRAAEDVQRTESRITAMEERLKAEAQSRHRNRKLALGAGLIALGIAAALIGALVIFRTALGISFAALGGFAFVLGGARVILGRQRGNELVAWAGLLATVAAVVVAVVLR
jgi:hypothetical protein